MAKSKNGAAPQAEDVQKRKSAINDPEAPHKGQRTTDTPPKEKALESPKEGKGNAVTPAPQVVPPTAGEGVAPDTVPQTADMAPQAEVAGDSREPGATPVKVGEQSAPQETDLPIEDAEEPGVSTAEETANAKGGRKKQTFIRILKVQVPPMHGADVKALQLALIAQGHHCGASGANGCYDKDTAYAVRCFQSRRGLIVDGKAGPFTIKALGGVWKPTK